MIQVISPYEPYAVAATCVVYINNVSPHQIWYKKPGESISVVPK